MTDETITTLKALADLGGTAILTGMLYLVWQRLNMVTDRTIDILVVLDEIHEQERLRADKNVNDPE